MTIRVGNPKIVNKTQNVTVKAGPEAHHPAVKQTPDSTRKKYSEMPAITANLKTLSSIINTSVLCIVLSLSEIEPACR